MGASSPRILVTDAHTTGALAVVRSLGAQGMSVTVTGERGRSNLAFHSRHVQRTVTVPSADDEPTVFVERLVRELRDGYDLLIPTTDAALTAIRHQRDRFDGLARIALPANDVLDAALDKHRTICAATREGVAAPRTRVFRSLPELEDAAGTLAYPCVVKPRFSRQWTAGAPLLKGSTRYASSPASLIGLYRNASQPPDGLLVQELVSGTGVGVFVLADGGTPLAVFAHRRLRETNPTGGRASLAESIHAEQRILEPALRLIAALRWHGVAMVEFKDPGNGHAPYLMEINGRFWGSLPLAIAAGVDFPAMLVDLLTGRQVKPQTDYAVGVRCRYLKGDLSYLVAALKGRPAGWAGAFPSRVSAVAAVMPWPGRWRPYNFSLNDPWPALFEAGSYVRDEMTALTSRKDGGRSGRRADV